MNIQTAKSSPNSTTSPATATTVLAANLDRKRFTIQSQDDEVLYLKLGTGASSSDYHITLSAGSGAADGTGGIFTNDGYQGAVSVAASGTPSYSVIEYQ
jgi:hypothetical protein